METDLSVKKRVKKALIDNRISVNILSKYGDIRQSTLNEQINGTTKISVAALCALLEHNPDISAEWLLRGKGDMYITSGDQINIIASGDQINGDGNATRGATITNIDKSMYENIIKQKDAQIEELKCDKEKLYNLLMK